MMATGLIRILIVGSVSVSLRSLCRYEHIAYVIIKRVIQERRRSTPTVPNPIDLVYDYVHVMIVQCDIYIYIYIYIYIQNRRRLW
jgi:hypothetical protein